jgi:uncharacterized protein HemY
MTEASVVGLFRTILIILLIYYVIKWLVRLFFPLLIKKYFGNPAGNQGSNAKHEGDITIVKRGKKPTGKDDELGEYVDFEEVE